MFIDLFLLPHASLAEGSATTLAGSATASTTSMGPRVSTSRYAVLSYSKRAHDYIFLLFYTVEHTNIYNTILYIGNKLNQDQASQ